MKQIENIRKMQIDANGEFSHTNNEKFLLDRVVVTDDDRAFAQKILSCNLQIRNYEGLAEVLKNVAKKGANKQHTAYVIVGNIGSGKSTLLHALLSENFIDGKAQIILEDIYKKLFFNNCSELKEAYGFAKKFVCEKIKDAVSCHKDFVMELVPSSVAKLDLVKTFAQIGYKVVIFYVKTANVDVNVSRVVKRQNEGADFVSESKVRSRDDLTSANFPELCCHCDELYVFESQQNEFRLVSSLIDGVKTATAV